MLTFSNSLIYIHSVFHISNKLPSVVVPVGSSTAAAGDKLFGSRASWPLLLFNFGLGNSTSSLALLWSAEPKQSDAHSWSDRRVGSPSSNRVWATERGGKIQFALYCLCCWLAPSAEWCEDIMWNCLHDYPIKRLIHNLNQLKGRDCYSVFLTRFSQAVDWWGLPSATSLPSDAQDRTS